MFKRTAEGHLRNNPCGGKAIRITYSECVSVSLVIQHANCMRRTWGVQVLRSPNFFFSGMEADRNVKVVGGNVAVL